MKRKEKIINALKKMAKDNLNKTVIFDEIADAILALPLDVPKKMKGNDCVVDCIGPDCEGCRHYKTVKKMKKTMFPREFVEWLAFKSHGNFKPRFDLHKYWDGTVNEWRSTFRKFSGIIWEDITLDELYEYWRLEQEQ